LKNTKPIHIILGGSAIIAAVTLISVIILTTKVDDFPIWASICLPLLTGSASFVVFYFFIQRFINDRLKLLYKSIRKGKITKANEVRIRMSDDVIAQAEKETNDWTEERNLEIQQLKLQEAFRREFLGNLAHELKTPVFSIQGYILTLLEGGLEDDNVNRMFLERAGKATDRITGILEDLDQITQLEVNDIKPDMKPFDIVELINEVFDTLENKAREKSITLKLAKNFGVIKVTADEGKIAQVITNIVNNSILYGREDGETTIRLYAIDDLVTVEISDDGPGIEEVNIPRLFERFYRVEKSRNRHQGGSGIGLAIVKHIIESHGQTISVRSTVGLGSTFSFTLDNA
jgi:two-component system phosphate regulon sensor histidine kinase PhoR